MAAIVPRTSDWKSTYALVVISPAMTTRPVAVRVSQATRLEESSARQASRMASEIWSAILSGWPSVTDSEVNKIRFFTVEVGGKILFSLETASDFISVARAAVRFARSGQAAARGRNCCA